MENGFRRVERRVEMLPAYEHSPGRNIVWTRFAKLITQTLRGKRGSWLYRERVTADIIATYSTI